MLGLTAYAGMNLTVTNRDQPVTSLQMHMCLPNLSGPDDPVAVL